MIVNAKTARTINTLALEDPTRIGTLKFERLVIGALIRKTVRDSFMEIEIAGGKVSYKENKGPLESTFYNVVIEGNARLLNRTVKWMNSID